MELDNIKKAIGIKPYFETELGVLYNADCLDILPKIPDKTVDLVLTDPPYNISKLNDNRDRSKLNSPIMRRKSPLCYDFGEWDNKDRKSFLSFTENWLHLTITKLKERATIGSFFNKEDISFLGWTAKKLGIRTRTIISWHKTNPVPSFRKVNYLSACEFIWLGSFDGWKINFRQQKEMHNFYETGNSSGYGESEHPTEKPIPLFSWIINNHTDINDLVLDPFLGSGTTAVACESLNRRWIGIEKEEKYCEIAKNRIMNTDRNLF